MEVDGDFYVTIEMQILLMLLFVFQTSRFFRLFFRLLEFHP